MEIGKLNHRITILEQCIKIDEIGNHTSRWEESFSLWASVTAKSSSEITDTGVTRNIQTLEFLVRQKSCAVCLNTTQFRVLFQSRVYDITGILPYYNHNAYLKIQATARKQGDPDAA